MDQGRWPGGPYPHERKPDHLEQIEEPAGKKLWHFVKLVSHCLIMEIAKPPRYYSEQSLAMARKIGDPGLINHCLIYLCAVFVHTKQFKKGEPLLEELLISSEKLEHIFGIVGARHMLGDCAVGMKNHNEGEKRYAVGIETALKYGNIFYQTFDLQGVAFALSGQSRWAKAIRLDAAAREKFRITGITVDGMAEFWDEFIETYIEGAKKEVGEELTRQYKEEGIAMGFEAAIDYALNFNKD